jgi:hypothetical protein
VAGGYSYNGWPASDSASAIGVNTKWTVNGITAPGGMKAGDVDTVMAYLFNALDTRVEEAVPGWCWGWNYRANANNPNNLSNHSSATALDYNAPDHPNGGSQYEGWTSAQVSTIRTILNVELEGCIEWGADYSGTKDSMHFDVEVSASRLAQLATKIRNQEDDMPLSDEDAEKVADKVLAKFNAQLVKWQDSWWAYEGNDPDRQSHPLEWMATIGNYVSGAKRDSYKTANPDAKP